MKREPRASQLGPLGAGLATMLGIISLTLSVWYFIHLLRPSEVELQALPPEVAAHVNEITAGLRYRPRRFSRLERHATFGKLIHVPGSEVKEFVLEARLTEIGRHGTVLKLSDSLGIEHEVDNIDIPVLPPAGEMIRSRILLTSASRPICVWIRSIGKARRLATTNRNKSFDLAVHGMERYGRHAVIGVFVGSAMLLLLQLQPRRMRWFSLLLVAVIVMSTGCKINISYSLLADGTVRVSTVIVGSDQESHSFANWLQTYFPGWQTQELPRLMAQLAQQEEDKTIISLPSAARPDELRIDRTVRGYARASGSGMSSGASWVQISSEPFSDESDIISFKGFFDPMDLVPKAGIFSDHPDLREKLLQQLRASNTVVTVQVELPGKLLFSNSASQTWDFHLGMPDQKKFLILKSSLRRETKRQYELMILLAFALASSAIDLYVLSRHRWIRSNHAA